MQPEIRTRSHWPWRRWLALFFCVLLSLVGLLALNLCWKRWGPLPDIQVRGRVVDRDTGIGVPDADVILSMTASESMWHGSHRGCAEGSAVVHTDGAGNFEYSITAREAFGPRNPSGWSITIFVYHPAYEAALRHNLLPHELREISALSVDGPPLPVPGGYRTYPLYAYKNPGPFVIDVTARRESELDQLAYFGTSLFDKCLYTKTDRGQSKFLSRVFLRTWASSCNPEALAHGLSSDEFEIARNVLYATLAAIGDLTNAYGSEQERDQRNSDRSEYLWMHRLWEYPEHPGQPGYGRGPTNSELSIFCDTYAPPIENTFNKEFRPWINAQQYLSPPSQ